MHLGRFQYLYFLFHFLSCRIVYLKFGYRNLKPSMPGPRWKFAFLCVVKVINWTSPIFAGIKVNSKRILKPMVGWREIPVASRHLSFFFLHSSSPSLPVCMFLFFFVLCYLF